VNDWVLIHSSSFTAGSPAITDARCTRLLIHPLLATTRPVTTAAAAAASDHDDVDGDQEPAVK